MYSMYHLDQCLSKEVCQIGPLKVCLAKALMMINPLFFFFWEFKNNFCNAFQYIFQIWKLNLSFNAFPNFPLKQDSIVFITLLFLSNSKSNNKCICNNFNKLCKYATYFEIHHQLIPCPRQSLHPLFFDVCSDVLISEAKSK